MFKKRKFDDRFIVFKKIFFEFAYSKEMKIYNMICLVFHSFSFVLQVYFIVQNFSVELITRYGCILAVFLYLIAAMSFAIFIEKQVKMLEVETTSFFWPIDCCGPQVKKLIYDRSARINILNYFTLAWFTLFGIIMLPVWGDQSEWFLCIQVFQQYFGSCWKLFYYFYFSTCPMIAFTAFRLPGLMLYGILHIDLQLVLIYQKIAQLSARRIFSENIVDNAHYQKTVFRKLKLCISHHVKLKTCLRKLIELIQMAMPVFIFVGAVCSIAVLFFLLYVFSSSSHILKIRLAISVVSNVLIVYTFSAAGQAIADETSHVFDTLMTCPWNAWNNKNRKVLLIIMSNTLRPLTFTLAGITLNYKFGLTMIRISYTYALILYNLN
ncbi:odorant receptor 197 [Tribolium castaneum]|uniref:Odorant receptor n=1 Tax=Tribolium castaneum TaxID=7070 RepID=D2A351_TRICA|nr:odorant receptor 197 [Tribolium castaneum]